MLKDYHNYDVLHLYDDNNNVVENIDHVQLQLLLTIMVSEVISNLSENSISIFLYNKSPCDI